MIRIEDRVPRYYVEESRDFQLLCRLLTLVSSGLCNNAKVVNVTEPASIKSTLLPLACNKLGFYSSSYIDDSLLRKIFHNFSQIVRNKGSKTAIELAVSTLLSSEMHPNARKKPYIDVDNIHHKITIRTPVKTYNKKALKMLLDYIVPTGTIVEITSYNASANMRNFQDTISHNDSINIINSQTQISSSLREASNDLNVSSDGLHDWANSRSRLENIFSSGQVISSIDFVAPSPQNK